MSAITPNEALIQLSEIREKEGSITAKNSHAFIIHLSSFLKTASYPQILSLYDTDFFDVLFKSNAELYSLFFLLCQAHIKPPVSAQIDIFLNILKQLFVHPFVSEPVANELLAMDAPRDAAYYEHYRRQEALSRVAAEQVEYEYKTYGGGSAEQHVTVHLPNSDEWRTRRLRELATTNPVMKVQYQFSLAWLKGRDVLNELDTSTPLFWLSQTTSGQQFIISALKPSPPSRMLTMRYNYYAAQGLKLCIPPQVFVSLFQTEEIYRLVFPQVKDAVIASMRRGWRNLWSEIWFHNCDTQDLQGASVFYWVLQWDGLKGLAQVLEQNLSEQSFVSALARPVVQKSDGKIIAFPFHAIMKKIAQVDDHDQPEQDFIRWMARILLSPEFLIAVNDSKSLSVWLDATHDPLYTRATPAAIIKGTSLLNVLVGQAMGREFLMALFHAHPESARQITLDMLFQYDCEIFQWSTFFQLCKAYPSAQSKKPAFLPLLGQILKANAELGKQLAEPLKRLTVDPQMLDFLFSPEGKQVLLALVQTPGIVNFENPDEKIKSLMERLMTIRLSEMFKLIPVGIGAFYSEYSPARIKVLESQVTWSAFGVKRELEALKKLSETLGMTGARACYAAQVIVLTGKERLEVGANVDPKAEREEAAAEEVRNKADKKKLKAPVYDDIGAAP